MFAPVGAHQCSQEQNDYCGYSREKPWLSTFLFDTSRVGTSGIQHYSFATFFRWIQSFEQQINGGAFRNYPVITSRRVECAIYFEVSVRNSPSRQTRHQPGMFANLARGQLNGGIGLYLSPFASEGLVSPVRLDCPVPCQPAHSPHLD